MIKKIKNLELSKTEKQHQNAWGEVLSHRNKLLETSDWTQLQDSGLSEHSVQLWASWRKELKRINKRNFNDKDLAKRAIENLAQVIPNVVYDDESSLLLSDKIQEISIKSLQSRKESLLKSLSKQFLNKSNSTTFDKSFSLIDEEFEEACLFKKLPDEKLEEYPLIKLAMELENKTSTEIVEAFINNKREKLRSVIVLKRKFVYFKKAIEVATSMVEYQAIERDIQEWISTLI